jgi:hypothetical protein
MGPHARSDAMLAPHLDLAARTPVWDGMQMLWMDTDPAFEIESIARACAASRDSLDELAAIYWNEVRPALAFNRRSHLGEWRGFEREWLQQRILATHRYGRPLPWRWLHPGLAREWERLAAMIDALRAPSARDAR